MTFTKRKEFIILAIFIAAFILIRSINYVYHLNFSGDQATFATVALEIFREKKLVLIGPPISMNLEGRQIFQGPLTYYFFLLFLLPAKFEPITASYIFMSFCALMIIPLYYGTKWLVNSFAALTLVSLYVFAPYYINFSRFLWNPTFQLAITPLLIFLMGWYHRKKSKPIFFALSILLGAMLQFHYQFVLVIAGLFIYYFLIKKTKLSFFFLFIAGLVIGFFPIILFELRNNFYNTNTFLLFLKNLDKVDKPGGTYRGHYYLSLSLLAYLTLFSILKKLYFDNGKRLRIKKKKLQKTMVLFLIALNIVLVSWALVKFSPRPRTAFWAGTGDWNYLNEAKIYENIKSTGLKKNYNIANLAYDQKAIVPKYLLKVDRVDIDYVDYWHNQYLFVIEETKKDFRDDEAYEVKYFKPFQLLKTWKINETYSMYLLKRT